VATIDRGWTGEVTIDVVEREPAAVIEADGGFAIVDVEGRQVEVSARRPEGYLAIDGLVGSGIAGDPAPDGVLGAVSLLRALPAPVAEQVAGVAVTERGLRIELVDGGGVDFGDGTELAAKLQAFETILARVDLRCLDTIDVRVPAAPTVSRRGDLVDDGADGSDDPSPADQADNGKVPDSPFADC
jgi:cell division protein FtsQ